uniref:Uncharacterized protein n=1 Tax=Lygus hesperus TaxID=30085 RepID=A0A146L9K3_LYGHE
MLCGAQITQNSANLHHHVCKAHLRKCACVCARSGKSAAIHLAQIPFTGVSVRWFGATDNPLQVHSLTWHPNAIQFFANSVNNKYDSYGISIEGCRTAGPIVDGIVTGAILDYELHRNRSDDATALCNMDVFINANGRVSITPCLNATPSHDGEL